MTDMTPKEKAHELVLKYLRIDNNTKEWFNIHIAKQCALIAVDEIIEALPCREEYGGEWKLIDNTEYWEEVKQELESIS